MPPKGVRVQVARRGQPKVQQRGYVGAAYDALTSPEHASVVRSVAAFGVGVAILSSSWAEIFLPPEISGLVVRFRTRTL
ncbi:hypothetical protein RB597_008177 [Gaeumannomyces tritici]